MCRENYGGAGHKPRAQKLKTRIHADPSLLTSDLFTMAPFTDYPATPPILEESKGLFSSSMNPTASNKRRKRNQSISERKSRQCARRHVATEGFCVARVAGSGSCCPQYAQFAQVG